MEKTIVALYDHFSDARGVVEQLVDVGIDAEHISLVARDGKGDYATYLEGTGDTVAEEVTEAAGAGAVGGALVGGLAGVLVGLGALALPGIGPVVAAGPLAAGLAGAGLGAATGGLLGAMIEWGIPEEEAQYYAEGVRRGGALVVVRAPEAQVHHVTVVMNDFEPVDVEERAARWREGGWEGYDPDAPDLTSEELHVEYQRYADIDLDEIEDEDFNLFEAEFREHHHEHYAPSGYPYEDYEPAYRHGYMLAVYEDYEDWDELEPEARRHWESAHKGAWDQFKDAVRYAWEGVLDALDFEDLDYDAFDETFRDHYSDTFDTAVPYAHYEPAYRYGYDLAFDERNQGRDWVDIEADFRDDWERRSDAAWDDVKQAVRQAWIEVSDAIDFDEEYDEDTGYEIRYHDFDDTFRGHHRSRYGVTRPYDSYESAYRYGYDLALDERYDDADAWDNVAPDARRQWEADYEGAWDEFKDAVRHAWEEVRDVVAVDDEDDEFEDDDEDWDDTAVAQPRGARAYPITTPETVADYDVHREKFRRHYESSFDRANRDFDAYEPAYQYGFLLAQDERYQDHDWEELEETARERWAEEHEGEWEEFKSAVHYSWNQAAMML